MGYVSTRRIRCCGFAVLLLGVSWHSLGQTPEDWRSVSVEEMAIADNPALPGSSAILLDRDSFVDDSKSFLTEYYRIKVLKGEGRKFADIEIPYIPKSDEVTAIRARVIQPNGTPEEFHGEVFDKVIVKSKHFSYQAKTFTLPGVQVGSILEYSYRIQWRQHAPDVLKHPQEYFFAGVLTFPTVHWTIQHELYTRHARFAVRPIPKTNLQWALIRGPTGAVVRRQDDGDVVLEVRDVPPLENEEMMPPPDFINSRVHFFYLVGATAYSANVASSFWQHVAFRDAKGIEQFIGQSKQLQRETARIISPGDSADAKLRKIYDRVQQIRYITYEPQKTEKQAKRENLKQNRDAEDVLRHGYGSGNEINFLFVAMVRAAGLQANVVRVADRSRQILDTAVLDESQFNSMIVNVHVANDDRFFDPATRFCPFEFIPWGESGVRGLLVMPFGGGFIKVPGYHNEFAVTRRTVTASISPEGALESTLHLAFSGQEALVRRLASYEEDEAGRKKAVEDEIKGWLPDTARIEVTSSSGWETSRGDLVVDAKISIPDFATVTGHRLLLPASIFHSFGSNPFRHATRKSPVYFPYSYQIVDDTTLLFPNRFHLAGKPPLESEPFADYIGFQRLTKERPDGIEIHRSFVLDGFLFDKAQYDQLKTFFERVSAHDADQIVLQQFETNN